MTILSIQGSIETSWRILYWLGGITGIIGFFMRFYVVEPAITPTKHPSGFHLLWNYRVPFIMIVFTSGLSYANYYMVTSLLNGYLPLISNISKLKAMEINTLILGVDFFIPPLVGLLTLRFSNEKLLYFFGGLIAILSIPLYSSLSGATYLTATFIRVIFVILGLGFFIALTPFYQDLIPREWRFTLIALGHTIGSQLFGTSACSFNFFLYKKTCLVSVPGFYLMGLAIIALLTIRLQTVLAKPKHPFDI